jgi:hypothetical protein
MARPLHGGADLANVRPTAAKEAHALNSGAPLATILNDVVAFTVGHAFFDLHCLFAYKAAQQINQRAFIVVQMRPLQRRKSFLFQKPLPVPSVALVRLLWLRINHRRRLGPPLP